MYRLIAGSALFLFCVLLGGYFSKKKTEKAGFYSALCDFNANFIKELKFSRRPVIELLNEKYSSQNFNGLLSDVKQKKCVENVYDLKGALRGDWQNGLDLSDGEIEEIENYFSVIGSSDADSQTGECLRYGNCFEKRFCESEKKDKSLGTLYKKIGFIVGLIAFVVAI